MADDDYEYVSYKSPKTIVAETVYHFFRGGLYGAAFGLVGNVHYVLRGGASYSCWPQFKSNISNIPILVQIFLF
jgi:hypothetical protein